MSIFFNNNNNNTYSNIEHIRSLSISTDSDRVAHVLLLSLNGITASRQNRSRQTLELMVSVVGCLLMCVFTIRETGVDGRVWAKNVIREGVSDDTTTHTGNYIQNQIHKIQNNGIDIHLHTHRVDTDTRMWCRGLLRTLSIAPIEKRK